MENNARDNLYDIKNQAVLDPNGGAAIEVTGAGVVALPDIPENTIYAIINNPVAVRITFGVEATANTGIEWPAKSCPMLTSAKQVEQASIYWTAACEGAYVQFFS